MGRRAALARAAFARAAFAGAVLAIGVAALVTHQQGRWSVPDRWNPWAPLVVADPPGWLTRFKLDRLSRDATLCRSVLAATPFRFKPVADHEAGASCGWHDAVRIDSTGLKLNAAFTLACPAAVSLAMWERHVVQPEAQRWLDEPIARLEHVGSYACRNVNGATEGRRSRHATAEALDVSAFVTRSAREISIGRAWNGKRAGDAAFLRAVHDGACRYFDVVLGPDYNAAHGGHFHLERGGGMGCG